MRSIIIILTILFLFNPLVSSQSKTNTSISGKVFDKSTNQPLEYSTVSVINKESGKTINGSIADVHGNFVVTDVPYGTYKVDINFIGYEKNTIDSISLKPGRRSVSLGTLRFRNSRFLKGDRSKTGLCLCVYISGRMLFSIRSD